MMELVWMCGWVWKTPCLRLLFGVIIASTWESWEFHLPSPVQDLLTHRPRAGSSQTCPFAKTSWDSLSWTLMGWEDTLLSSGWVTNVLPSVTRTQGEWVPIWGLWRTHKYSPFCMLATDWSLLTTQHLHKAHGQAAREPSQPLSHGVIGAISYPREMACQSLGGQLTSCWMQRVCSEEGNWMDFHQPRFLCPWSTANGNDVHLTGVQKEKRDIGLSVVLCC
jgi:hypothetical protein